MSVHSIHPLPHLYRLVSWLMIPPQELLKQISGLAGLRTVGLEASAPPISLWSPALLRPKFLEVGQNPENLLSARKIKSN